MVASSLAGSRLPPRTAAAAAAAAGGTQPSSTAPKNGPAASRSINCIAAEYREDEIVEALFRLIPPSPSECMRYCVDVGARNGEDHDSVTHSLLVGGEKHSNGRRGGWDDGKTTGGWFGILIQPDSQLYNSLQRIHRPLGSRLLQVTPSAREGLSERSLVWILRQYTPQLPSDFDFLCLAGIGWSYWILRDLLGCRTYRPKLVCVPYNGAYPNDAVHVPDRGSKEGLASIRALVDLASDHQYQLVMTTVRCAFFVPDALYKECLTTESSQTGGRSAAPVKPSTPSPIATMPSMMGNLGREEHRMSIKEKVQLDSAGSGPFLADPKTKRVFLAAAQETRSQTRFRSWMFQRKRHIQADRRPTQDGMRTSKSEIVEKFKHQVSSAWNTKKETILDQIEAAKRQRQDRSSPENLHFHTGGSRKTGLMEREQREYFRPTGRRKAEDPPETREAPKTSTPEAARENRRADRQQKPHEANTGNSSTRIEPARPTGDDRCVLDKSRRLVRSPAPDPVGYFIDLRTVHLSRENHDHDEELNTAESGSESTISSVGDGEGLDQQEERHEASRRQQQLRDRAHFGSLEEYQAYLHALVFDEDDRDTSVDTGEQPPEFDLPSKLPERTEENNEEEEEEIVFAHVPADSRQSHGGSLISLSANDGANLSEKERGQFESKTIDLKSYCIDSQVDTEETRACARELVSALEEHGYALVHGSGISRFLCQDALAASQLLLHETPESVRISCIRENVSFRGYSPLCTEQSGETNETDMVRKFRVGPSGVADQPNVWPQEGSLDEETDEFIRASFQDYHDNARRVAIAIIKCLCDGLAIGRIHGISEPSIRQLLHIVQASQSSVLTLINCVRGSRHAIDKHLVAPHEDQNLISIVILDGGDCATFQYKNENGEWTNLRLPRVIPDDPLFLVYSGSSLRTWSNGLFPAKLCQILPAPGSEAVNGIVLSLKEQEAAVNAIYGDSEKGCSETEEPNAAMTKMASDLRDINATFKSMGLVESIENSYGSSQLSNCESSELTFDNNVATQTPGVREALALSSWALNSKPVAAHMLRDKAMRWRPALNRTDKKHRSRPNDTRPAAVTQFFPSRAIAASRAVRRERTSSAGSKGIEITTLREANTKPFQFDRKDENPFRTARDALLAKYGRGTDSNVAAASKTKLNPSFASSASQRRSETISKLLPSRFKRSVSATTTNRSTTIVSEVQNTDSAYTSIDPGSRSILTKKRVEERIAQLKRQRELNRLSGKPAKDMDTSYKILEMKPGMSKGGMNQLTTSQCDAVDIESIPPSDAAFDSSNKILQTPGSPRRPIAIDIGDLPGSPGRPIQVDDGFPVLTYLGCTSTSFQGERSSLSEMHADPLASEINSTESFSDHKIMVYDDESRYGCSQPLSCEQDLLPLAPSWNPPERFKAADPEIFLVDDDESKGMHQFVRSHDKIHTNAPQPSIDEARNHTAPLSAINSSPVPTLPDLSENRLGSSRLSRPNHNKANGFSSISKRANMTGNSQIFDLSWEDSVEFVEMDPSLADLQYQLPSGDTENMESSTQFREPGLSAKSRGVQIEHAGHTSFQQGPTQGSFDSKEASGILDNLLEANSVQNHFATNSKPNKKSIGDTDYSVEATERGGKSKDETFLSRHFHPGTLRLESPHGETADNFSHIHENLNERRNMAAVMANGLANFSPPACEPIFLMRKKPLTSEPTKMAHDASEGPNHHLRETHRLETSGVLQREAVSSFLYSQTISFPQQMDEEVSNNVKTSLPERSPIIHDAGKKPFLPDIVVEQKQQHQPNLDSSRRGQQHPKSQDEGTSYMGLIRKWKVEEKMLRELQLSKWAQQRIKKSGGGTNGGGAGGGGSISSLSDMTEDYKGGCTAAFCVQETLAEAIPL